LLTDLQEKVALVTDGSGGIGAAISRRLADEGAVVAVGFGSGAAAASAVAEEIAAGGDVRCGYVTSHVFTIDGGTHPR
jgi:3-oxoacyl-[acyl-carrier protein] reductase